MEYLDEIKVMVLKYAPSVLGAIVTLIVGFWLAGFFAKKVRKTMDKREVDASLVPFFTSLVNIGIKILVLLSAASMFGIEVTSFVAIFSALAFAVGLALQGNLSHMAAGIVILFFKYYKVGDFITVGGHSGTVKEIQIFNTLLTTLDNHLIIVPNGTILSGSIENYSSFDTRQVVLTFGIGYDDDIDQAKALLHKIAKDNSRIMDDKDVTIFVSELADSSVNFSFRAWVKSEDYWPAVREVTETVKKEFDKADIGIPFPQMDIYMRKMDEQANKN